MKKEEISNIIKQGENQNIEFKSNFNIQVIETLVAFANTKGGKIYIGVSDSGIFENTFTIEKETIPNWLNEIKTKTQPTLIPDIELIEIEKHQIVEISIQEFPIKPVSCRGKYFKRTKNSNHQMSINEISEVYLKTFNTSWDNYFTNDYNLENISLEKVNKFIDLSNRIRENAITDDPFTVLRKFELVKEEKISNACFLLFSNNDVFQANIDLGRFSSPTLIKDAITIRTDLFSEVEDVLNFVKKHINKEYIVTGNPQREERWQYPLNALREIIINMIIHRDYMHYGDSSVKIFDNKIEFFNPGKLPDNITIEHLISGEYNSEARNKKIATIFKEAGIIEKYGSGIRRIQEDFAIYNMEQPVFENFQHGFRVTVFSNKIFVTENVIENVVENVIENVVENRLDRILSLIKYDKYISAGQIALNLKITERTAQRDLEKLKLENIIIRVGPNKGGHWEIIKKSDN